MEMFCFQCEQTAKGTGCVTSGVCGKDPKIAALQDYLVYATKGIAQYAHRAAELGKMDREINRFVVDALFTTITNVNFDPERMAELIVRAGRMRDKAAKLYEDAAQEAGKQVEKPGGPSSFQVSNDVDELVKLGVEQGIEARKTLLGEDASGLIELSIYGLKGSAAYVSHAYILGEEDDKIYAGFLKLLDLLAGNPKNVQALTGAALEVGALNLKVMEILDRANTKTYGHPEPTAIRVTPIKGKCILVSGHDLKDLEELLKQTEGKGINIYTHGEMLPCNAYPGLKKYKHLVGNYGGAWQDQRKEFEQFPGAILMTTNCIQKPKESYNARIFTSGLVAWPGVTHIGNHDYSALIESALEAEGFIEDVDEKKILTGFGHNVVLGVADKVIEAVKGGKIRHFFLVGGCDGAGSGRNYYTDFTDQVPDDCVILTLACGKFRFNKNEFGDIEGIPRLLDMGQCNDAYSAIQVAVALAGAFECEVNDLPLSFIISWYEQKAVAILLTLFHLGIRNIHLGPTLPAFVTPNVLNVLVENFQIRPISTPEEDLAAILGDSTS